MLTFTDPSSQGRQYDKDNIKIVQDLNFEL